MLDVGEEGGSSFRLWENCPKRVLVGILRLGSGLSGTEAKCSERGGIAVEKRVFWVVGEAEKKRETSSPVAKGAKRVSLVEDIALTRLAIALPAASLRRGLLWPC